MGDLTALALQILRAAQTIDSQEMPSIETTGPSRSDIPSKKVVRDTGGTFAKLNDADMSIIEDPSLVGRANGGLAKVIEPGPREVQQGAIDGGANAISIQANNTAFANKTVQRSAPGPEPKPIANGGTVMQEHANDLEESKTELIDLTHRMQNIIRAPGALIYEHLYRFVDIASWLFVCNFEVPLLIPVDGEISYEELGGKLNVRPAIVRRYVENLMVSGFFEECTHRQGYIRHTPNSAAFVRDPKLLATISMLHDEMLPSILKSVDALKKWPLSQETNESGFCLANDTTDTMYQILAKNPKKAQRFGLAMSSFTKESFAGKHPLCTDYDWQTIDTAVHPTVVDLGGSLGHLSMYVARETSNIKFIIQDLPPTAEAGDHQCPEDMRSRLTFEAYDFFTLQKPRTKAVDAILVANTLQNWPDNHVVKILRNQVPILGKGSKILIYERPLPERADPRWSRRVARTADMLMGSLLNGMLRSPQQWKDLFQVADPRLSFIGLRKIGDDKGLVEAVFEG